VFYIKQDFHYWVNYEVNCQQNRCDRTTLSLKQSKRKQDFDEVNNGSAILLKREIVLFVTLIVLFGRVHANTKGPVLDTICLSESKLKFSLNKAKNENKRNRNFRLIDWKSDEKYNCLYIHKFKRPTITKKIAGRQKKKKNI
jgi:hypothetical protein